MGLSETMERAQRLLERRSVRDFELFGMASDTIRAESRQKEADFLTRSRESGISIRVIVDGGMGFSYGRDVDDDLIDAVVTSARYQFKDDHNHFPGRYGEYPSLHAHDREIEALDPDACIDRAITLELSARDADPRVENIRKASFARSLSEVHILNSHGIRAAFNVSAVSSSLMVTLRQDGDVQSGYDFDFSHDLAAFDVKRVGRTAVERAASLLGARQIRTSRIPVLFDRTSTAEILEFMADAFLGENVIKGKSALKDKLGRTCFSQSITITDDPLDPRAAEICPFDGEGVPSRRNELVRGGVLESFLYDSYWARRAGTVTTGNSVRGGYRSWPALGTRHLCLEAGPEPIAGVLETLPVTMKVTDIMGMHTANPITGELSVGINGILLEKGVGAYPVREAALSGNIYEMLSRVLAVGDDPRGFGHVCCPSLLIDAVDISSQ
ncbi:MAG TPA: TldD/PmbA family protein [Deltaproteobacteria bacterium]|nr:TldD/PmbA family protein [Deltaproteobacteria bacterium]OQC29284.1 MAG: peptidase PmbA [Deltaproteobacteria bacterium ADurb.Bin072]HRW80248.1 TldD/PmbA family protein [Desulfomonilia bacterium]HNQ85436.1 TldD/PmbA family protein [Deltaproteobacteria bacterium]HNS89692.1 TldD/PmbA family protein [Deltaproteobacteria bacterium]